MGQTFLMNTVQDFMMKIKSMYGLNAMLYMGMVGLTILILIMKPSDHKKVEKHLEFSKIKHIFAAQKQNYA